MSVDPGIFMLLAFALGYCLTLGYAHVLLARIDRKTKIHRPGSGQISIKNVKTLVIAGKENTELTKAIVLLKINSVIVVLFFAWLALNCIYKWL